MWWTPSPRASRNFPTGVSGDSGSSSCTYDAPPGASATYSIASFTPCASLVSRPATVEAERRARRTRCWRRGRGRRCRRGRCGSGGRCHAPYRVSHAWFGDRRWCPYSDRQAARLARRLLRGRPRRVAIEAALSRAGIAGDAVDYVIMGQVLQAGAGQITARQAAVKGGIPMTVPALTINKVCLSGLDAIALADQLIAAGEYDVVVAGGMESMTNAPHLLPGLAQRLQVRRHRPRRLDGVRRAVLRVRPVRDGGVDRGAQRRLGISREEQDAFSARSHQLAAAAQKNGVFDEEIVAGRGPAAPGRPGDVHDRRGRPRRHHGRGPGSAAAGVRQGRHDHCGLGVADLRRRVRRRRDVPRRGRATRRDGARRDRLPRRRRRSGRLAAGAAGQRDHQGAGRAGPSASTTST